MKLTPAMKIILAVAAICIAITLITTNNIATVMVLQGINTIPVAGNQNVSGGNQGGGSSNQGGYVDNGSGSADAGTGDAGNAGTGSRSKAVCTYESHFTKANQSYWFTGYREW